MIKTDYSTTMLLEQVWKDGEYKIEIGIDGAGKHRITLQQHLGGNAWMVSFASTDINEVITKAKDYALLGLDK